MNPLQPNLKPSIHSIDQNSEYYFEEGCYIIELSNSDADPMLSIAQARVSRGQRTRWHQLTNTVERYQVLSGVGIVEIGDLPPTHVNPGDTVIIPAGVRQRIHNSGESDLVFLALCTPRFQHCNYQDLEK